MDNGSVRPAATLMLRRLATGLGQVAGVDVDPVSLQHANRIPAGDLQGQPAAIVRDYLREWLQRGEREFVVLPLFFGVSRALTSLLPDIHAQLEQEFVRFEIKLGDVLYPLSGGEPALARILYDNILKVSGFTGHPPNIVLVDHGSPSPRVTEVRKHLRDDLAMLLPADTHLAEAVMERRKGREYDFNGPLLEDWLNEQADAGVESVVVSLMFLLPGRHAGAGGDIESICRQAMNRSPSLRVEITPLIGEHPALFELLHQRLSDCLA